MRSRSRPVRFQPRVTDLECRTVPSTIPADAVVIGSGPGAVPKVTVLDPTTGEDLAEFEPFENTFRGGVSVAVGDVIGDSTPDIVVAAGTGGGPRIEIIDGATQKVAENFFVFEPTFTGGVSVAIGDVNGDGHNDIIAGAGTGGGPRVVAIDVATGNTLLDTFAFEPTFRGGVNVSSGDVNGDGTDDIIVGTGTGGAPRVTAFSGTDTGNVLLNFFAFESSFRGGVNVSTADVNGDGTDDVIVGAGTGGAPHVQVFSGIDGAPLPDMNFFAFDTTRRGGVRVAAVDTNGDGTADTMVAGTPGQLRRFFRAVDGSTIASDITVLDVTGGVFVGGLLDGSHGKGHGNAGHGHGGHGAGVVATRTVAGVVTAVNPTLGTITVQTGPTGTLAIYKVSSSTELVLDGQTVTDLSGFAKGAVALVETDKSGVVEITAATPGTGTTVAAPIGASFEGAVTAVNTSAGTVTVLTQNGKLLLVPTDTETQLERNGDETATLSDFQVGDLVEIRTDADGAAIRIQAVGATST